MSEQNGLTALAEKYRTEGYKVTIHPRPEDLPEFARRTGEIAFVATKGRKFVLVQPRESEQAPEVLVVEDAGREYVHSLILEAEEVLRQDAPRAAFLVAWAAVEAAARDLLRHEGHDADKMPPAEMMRLLRQEGHLLPDETDALQRCLGLRNTIIHGMCPEAAPPAELITFLVALARRLGGGSPYVLEAEGGSIAVSGGAVSVTVIRAKVIQSPELKKKVDRADGWLRDILGASQGNVSTEWDLAEDARVRPVVVLTIADYTGKVAMAFEPQELDDESHTRFRLNRLWGNLLSIRSHKEVQGLIYMSGGGKVDGL